MVVPDSARCDVPQSLGQDVHRLPLDAAVAFMGLLRCECREPPLRFHELEAHALCLQVSQPTQPGDRRADGFDRFDGRILAGFAEGCARADDQRELVLLEHPQQHGRGGVSGSDAAPDPAARAACKPRRIGDHRASVGAVAADGILEGAECVRRAAAGLAADKVSAAHPPRLAANVLCVELRHELLQLLRCQRRGGARQALAAHPAEGVLPYGGHLRRVAEAAVHAVEGSPVGRAAVLTEGARVPVRLGRLGDGVELELDHWA